MRVVCTSALPVESDSVMMVFLSARLSAQVARVFLVCIRRTMACVVMMDELFRMDATRHQLVRVVGTTIASSLLFFTKSTLFYQVLLVVLPCFGGMAGAEMTVCVVKRRRQNNPPLFAWETNGRRRGCAGGTCFVMELTGCERRHETRWV